LFLLHQRFTDDLYWFIMVDIEPEMGLENWRGVILVFVYGGIGECLWFANAVW
jgi:hypothetical protein